MTYIEINHVILAIINCKRKHFNEEYVTYEELNIIKSEIQKRFNQANIAALIDSTKINQDYFESKKVISLHKSWAETTNHFQNINNLEIIKILLDENFILNSLLKISKETNSQQESITIDKKNLLQEYKNKLKILQDRNKNQKSWLEDLKFYTKVSTYYNFLTNDFYYILKKSINNINLSNINNPYVEFKYKTENNEDLLKKAMFLNFIETYNLSPKKEVFNAPNGTNTIKIYLTNLEDLLKSYYLELEKMEYLYYPEELGQTR